jgi:hypothetical protein
VVKSRKELNAASEIDEKVQNETKNS